MDKDAAKRYIEGHRATNEIVIEEERRRTPEERFRRFLEFREWLESVGKLSDVDEDLPFYERWSKLQRNYLERSKAV